MSACVAHAGLLSRLPSDPGLAPWADLYRRYAALDPGTRKARALSSGFAIPGFCILVTPQRRQTSAQGVSSGFQVEGEKSPA